MGLDMTTQAHRAEALEAAQEAGEDWRATTPVPEPAGPWRRPTRPARPALDDLQRRIREADADQLLDHAFGPPLVAAWSALPNAAAIDRVLDESYDLTYDQTERMESARSAVSHRAWFTAGTACADAGRSTGRSEIALAACAATAGLFAVKEAVVALILADLVGQHGLTQDHVDTLLRPWATVMGDPRTGGA